VKITQALAVVARARIRRRISSDAAAKSDNTGTMSPEVPIALRDMRGRFVKGHACGLGRPPRDCFRALSGDLFLSWRRHGRQALRQLRQENPGSYLRLVAGLVESERRSITARRAGRRRFCPSQGKESE
jgi:hypothetical protein